MSKEEEIQEKVEQLEDFDKYFNSIYDRYSNLLSKGEKFVFDALKAEGTNERTDKILKGDKVKKAIDTIFELTKSHTDAALISHNIDKFFDDFKNPLSYNIIVLSNFLNQVDNSRTDQIVKECETMDFDSYRPLKPSNKSLEELYKETKQKLETLLKEVIVHKISPKNDEITLTLGVTNTKLISTLENVLAKGFQDRIQSQDLDTLTQVVCDFLTETKKNANGVKDVKFKLDGKTYWKTCVQTSDEKMAEKLISNPGDRPDKETLKELCAVFGRKSDITFKVCKKVCDYIKESSPHIIDVYASRKAVVLKHNGEKEEEFEIKFVVITESLDEDGRKKLEVRIQKDYDTLPIRDHYQLSGEEKECSKRRRHELKGEDLNRIKTSMRLNAHSLLEKHTYLTIISGCPFKSKGYDTGYHETDFKQPCIVLNVPYKGHIPIDEDPFQNEYDGVLTDVREDIFVLYNGTAKDRHDHLKAGCLISGKKDNSGRCCKGTLGGFVVHPDYGPCGISCCHALLTPSELNELSENNEINWKRPSLLEGKHDKALDGSVFQPSDNGEGDINKIGSLVRVCYKSGKTNSLEADACGMEVTLFQLSNRLPKSSEFPVVKVSGANVLTEESNEDSLDCRKVPHQFGKGAVAGFDWLEGERYCKFGAITGYTTGELSINCTTSVKKPNTWTQKDKLNTNNNFRFILHNQVSIKKKNTDINNILPTDIPTESEERFAYVGDSGALVYRETTDGNLVCVGMVAGGPKDQTTCIVTPILPILKELGITGFKDFDSEQLEVNVKTLVGDTGDLRKKIDRMDGDLRQKMDSGFKDISNQLSNMQNSRFQCAII